MSEIEGLEGTVDAATLAKILGVTTSTIHRMARVGDDLPRHVMVGDRKRFPITAVNAFLSGKPEEGGSYA
jgi:predicted DNA-binding transcriptional regulator AlpA